MTTSRYSALRDWIALIVVAVACPLAVFGGTNIGCVGQSFSASCVTAAVVISPMLLVIAGVGAGLITRGWTGLLMVGVGTVVGMFAILVLSYAAGRPVPVDWFSGVFATFWFMGPIVIGYGVGRLATRLWDRRRRGREDRPTT
jgi:hypothetical protein